MQKGKYNSYREVYYEDAISYIDEKHVDEVIKLLKLNPDSISVHGYADASPRTTKECIWRDLGSSFMMENKPSPSESGTTPKNVYTHAGKLLKTLEDAKSSLFAMQYKNLSEVSKEYIVSQRMRNKSDLKKNSPRVIYSEGYGIYLAQTKKQKDVCLHPFDKELDETVTGLDAVIGYLRDVELELIEEKAAEVKKGKTKSQISDDILVSLCRIYKKYTGKNPSAISTGGSPSGRRVIGGVIPYLQMLLILTSYSRKCGDEALEKAIKRIKETGNYPDIWTDN